MVTSGAKDDENIGRDPHVVPVHPIIDEQVAADVHVIAFVVADAQRGYGFGQGRVLPVGFGDGFTVGRWVADG